MLFPEESADLIPWVVVERQQAGGLAFLLRSLP